MRTNLLILLLGTAAYASPTPKEIVIREGPSCETVHLSVPDGIPIDLKQATPPFISHFVSNGVNMYYKPKFIEGHAPLAMPYGVGPVVPQVTMVEESRVLQPQAIEPSFVLPEAPAMRPIIMEEYIEPAKVFPNIPIEIPSAPLLPELIMPQLPVHMEIPQPEIKVIAEDFSRYEDIIPMAPVLPPFVMPMIPSPPVLPSIILPELPMPVEISEGVSNIHKEPIEVPEAPVLPPFVMPEIPVTYVLENTDSGSFVGSEISLAEFQMPEAPIISLPLEQPLIISENLSILNNKAIAIPEAPLLPPLVISEMPVTFVLEGSNSNFNIGNEISYAEFQVHEASIIPQPSVEIPTFISEDVSVLNNKLISIPDAPILPPLVLPEMPVSVLLDDSHSNEVSYIVPQVPEVPIIPSPPILPPIVLPQLPMHIETPLPIVPPVPNCEHVLPVTFNAPQFPEYFYPGTSGFVDGSNKPIVILPPQFYPYMPYQSIKSDMTALPPPFLSSFNCIQNIIKERLPCLISRAKRFT